MKTYYVAKAGSPDAYTVRAGARLLAPGDKLIIDGGWYPEALDAGEIPSGIDDSWHTSVEAAPGASVILAGAGVKSDVLGIAGRFITVDGLELVGGNDGGAGAAANTCVRIGDGASPSSFIKLVNVVAHHSGHGISMEGRGGFNHHLTFLRVTAFHNGFSARGYAVTGNPSGHNIYLTASDSLVDDCVLYDAESHGLHIYGAGDYTSTARNVVRNSRIFDNGSFGAMLSSGAGNVAVGNLFSGNGRLTFSGGLRVYDGAEGNVLDANESADNNGYGIWLMGGYGTILRNNRGAGNSGGFLRDDAEATVYDNSAAPVYFIPPAPVVPVVVAPVVPAAPVAPIVPLPPIPTVPVVPAPIYSPLPVVIPAPVEVPIPAPVVQAPAPVSHPVYHPLPVIEIPLPVVEAPSYHPAPVYQVPVEVLPALPEAPAIADIPALIAPGTQSGAGFEALGLLILIALFVRRQ